MAYSQYYSGWVDADYDSDGRLITPSTTPFTAASAQWWDDALADALPQTAKGDLVGYSGGATVRLPVGSNGTVLTADSTQTAGVRWASAGASGGAYTSVTAFNATGDGTTNDTSAIQAAINSVAGAGGTVWFPTPVGGSYRTIAPLDVPPNVTLLMQHGDTLQYTGAAPSPNSIKPLAGFAPTTGGVIQLRDKQLSGLSTDYVGSRLIDITIDGTALPGGGNVRGVLMTGLVREVTCENVTVRRVTGNGFEAAVNVNNNLSPQSLRFRGCVADNVGAAGFSVANVPDTTFVDCNAQGSGFVGFYIAGLMNGQMIGCRAEWSAQYGFYVTSGYWGTGQGSGGMNMLACLSDRNNYDGVFIDATGAAQVQITGCTFRRDGRAGGTTYAGVRANAATLPVVIDNVAVYPGVNDDGTGTLSPYAGASATGTTSFAVTSGYLHAVTAPSVNGGGNGAFVVSPMVGTATGAATSPTRIAAVGPAPATVATNVKTASYTLTLADINASVEMNVAGANNLTVPPNSSVPYPIGTMIEICQYGAGQTTIVAGAGVTLRSSSSLTTRAQYSTVSLRQRATNEWIVAGDLT